MFDNRGLRKLPLATAVALLAVALVVSLGGVVDLRVAGVTLRVHGAVRPLVAGILLLIAYAALDRRAVIEALRDRPRTIARLAPWLAAIAALSVTTMAIAYGAFVAGGSDAYGYLSQAYGWARGELPRPYPNPLTLPFASSDWLQTPLGYWPGAAPHTIVPSYAPGLPLLMAIGIRIADPIGPYLIVPLSAGVFVWVTFLLGRRMFGPVAGLAAALLAATSPVALFMALWPLSDLPSAAIWTGAAAAAIGRTRRDTIVSGLCAALGILVRPNLAPLAILPLIFRLKAEATGSGEGLKAEATGSGEDLKIEATGEMKEKAEAQLQIRRVVSAFRRNDWRSAALYCALCAPAAIAIAWLNTFWYGSPFLSGYGDPHVFYSLDHVWPNLQRYPVWLWQSQSAWIAVAGASLIALARRSPARAPVAFAWTMSILTLLLYLPYSQYDLWWYLRFMLPGMGALFALIAVGLVTIARGVPRPWGHAIACAVFALIVWHAVAFARAQQMWGPFKASEHKYADVGAFIARRLPDNAVVFAMQHSGSIRYYGGRHTLRYDLMDGATASRAPAALEHMGLHPYLTIEDAETPDVKKVFGFAADRPLPWPYVARSNRFGVSIFDLSARPSGEAPVPIEPGLAAVCAPPLRR